MALWFTLKVNDDTIGLLYARRVEGGTAPDDVNTYEAELDSRDVRWAGRVEHRFGDGAWGLVRRVLEAAESGKQGTEVH